MGVLSQTIEHTLIEVADGFLSRLLDYAYSGDSKSYLDSNLAFGTLFLSRDCDGELNPYFNGLCSLDRTKMVGKRDIELYFKFLSRCYTSGYSSPLGGLEWLDCASSLCELLDDDIFERTFNVMDSLSYNGIVESVFNGIQGLRSDICTRYELYSQSIFELFCNDITADFRTDFGDCVFDFVLRDVRIFLDLTGGYIQIWFGNRCTFISSCFHNSLYFRLLEGILLRVKEFRGGVL